MKWKLYPVPDGGGLAYCFPALMQPLTGCSYETACGYINAIRRVNPKTPVTGVNDHEISEVLRAIGLRFYTTSYENKKRPTVTQFANRAEKNVLYMLSLTQHVILLYNGKIIDNRTHLGPNPVREDRSARWLIDNVYRFRDLQVCMKRPSTVYCEDSGNNDFPWRFKA